MNMQHWTLARQGDVAQLVLDKQDSPVNALSKDVLAEFEALLSELEQDTPKGLVLSSTKAAGFLAGADVNEFTGLDTEDDLMVMLRRGQDLFLRFERLSCIKVAAIHGHCLGGGLELALCCDYRIVDEDRSCKLGLPEVKLGIHPGYGGAVRLPRLINGFNAINMMLAGRVLDGKAAKRMGVADIATQKRHLLTVANKVASGQLKPKRKTALVDKAFELKPVRQLVAMMIRSKMRAKANPEHYPAPYHLLNFWVDSPAGDEPAYQAEAESVVGIYRTSEGRRAIKNLVRIFLLDKDIKARAKVASFDGQHVHVVGAGVMGGDIAAWCALKGFKVTLQDAKPEFIAPAIKRAHKLFKKKLKQDHLVMAAMDRLIPDPDADGLPAADLVIEAITERLEAKQGLFAALEPRMKPTAILASNTSSIPLESLSETLARPERLVGIHFFNPVAMMPLVEIVRGSQSSDAVVAEALAFVNKIGKTPLEVKSSPGFLVNRVLMTYVSEAIRLYEEGIAPELIDKAALDFGMPMGPIELADTVGIDICQAVASELMAAYGGNDSGVCQKMIDQGHLGKKSGQGFYRWQKGKAVKNKVSDSDFSSASNDVTDRMIYAFLNECVQCLADGIVSDQHALDMGMIFGTGFAPFRGGPLSHIHTIGKETAVARLQVLAETVDSRFQPQPGWSQLET